jgi:hypothetical protein
MTVICDVTPEVDRFHLRIAGTEYRLAAVHGDGGPFRGNAASLALFLGRQRSLVTVYVQYRASGQQTITSRPGDIEVLGHVGRSE